MAFQTVEEFKANMNTNIRATATDIYNKAIDVSKNIAPGEPVNIFWKLDKNNTIAISLHMVDTSEVHRGETYKSNYVIVLVSGWYNQSKRLSSVDPSGAASIINLDKETGKPDLKACIKLSRQIYKSILNIYMNSPIGLQQSKIINTPVAASKATGVSVAQLPVFDTTALSAQVYASVTVMIAKLNEVISLSKDIQKDSTVFKDHLSVDIPITSRNKITIEVDIVVRGDTKIKIEKGFQPRSGMPMEKKIPGTQVTISVEPRIMYKDMRLVSSEMHIPIFHNVTPAFQEVKTSPSMFSNYFKVVYSIANKLYLGLVKNAKKALLNRVFGNS